MLTYYSILNLVKNNIGSNLDIRSMRLCLFMFVVWAACLGQVSCNVRIGNRTDIEHIYSKLLDKMIHVLGDLVNKTDNPSSVDEDRAACIYGLNAFFRNLGSGWALAMIDSSSKLQSGILSGNLMDLGAYDECLKVSVGPTETEPNLPTFTGQHCLTANKIFIPNGSIVVNGKKQDLVTLFGASYVPITLAQCYPSLCKPYVIEEGLNAVFSIPENVFDILGTGYSINVTIDPIDCHTAKGPPIDAVDWTVMAVILMFLTLGLVSTALDYYYTKMDNKKLTASPVMRILGSFSYYSNAKKIFSVKMGRDALPSLNGLRFFSMCWVIIGHRYLYMVREPITNYADLPDFFKDIWKMIIVNGPMSVDTFFLISGMLNMYGFLNTIARTKRFTIKDLLDGYIHRYLRLTPAYLMMIAFTATWLYRMRDGPLWDRFVGDYKDSCRRTYWVNLVYLNNYLHTDDYCMMQSWYLAADMQLYWLAPIAMYPLWRWPKYGWAQLGVLTVASIISPFLVSWYGHIASPVPVTVDMDKRAREMALLYYPMHTKSVSYVLGIAAGCILHKYKKGKVKLEFNLWQRAIGWLVAASMMLYAIFGGYYLFQVDYEYNQLFSAFFIGFQRFFWSCGLLWIILMCVKGHGGFINSFLSLSILTPLAKLSYCVYLTHIVILMCSIAPQRTTFWFNDYGQVEMYLGDLTMCLFAALILSLLVEVPLSNIQSILRGGGRRKAASEGTRPSAPSQQTHPHVA